MLGGKLTDHVAIRPRRGESVCGGGGGMRPLLCGARSQKILVTERLEPIIDNWKERRL